MAEPGSAPSEQSAPRPWFWQRWSLAGALARGCFLALFVGVFSEAVHHLMRGNRRTVVRGLIYRCGQPTADDVEELARQHGVRTIVNLRGHCAAMGWYLEEARAANRHNVALEDLNFSAGQLPSSRQVRRLVEVIDRSQYPIAFHCFRGVDRTGLASAISLLLKTDATPDEARESLSFRYLHLRWGRTGHLDRFFDLYDEWRSRTGQAHDSDVFRHWLLHEYNGGACSARIELLGAVGPQLVTRSPSKNGTLPALSLPRGDPVGLRVRVHNTSSKPWHFHPGDTAGFHLAWYLRDSRMQPRAQGRAGRFHATVEPGQSIDLVVPLPPLREPGDYFLMVDMIEEQHCHFHQAGSEALHLEVEVP